MDSASLYFVFSPREREEDSFGNVIKKSHFLFVMYCMEYNIQRSVLPGTEQTVTVYRSCTVKYLTEHSVDNRKNQFVSETEDVESGSAFRTIGVFSLPGICMIT